MWKKLAAEPWHVVSPLQLCCRMPVDPDVRKFDTPHRTCINTCSSSCGQEAGQTDLGMEQQDMRATLD